MRVSCIQIAATQDWENNLGRIRRLVDEAVRQRSNCIALPENFIFRGSEKYYSHIARKVAPRVTADFCSLARRKSVAFLLGSLLAPSHLPNRFFSESVLISSDGRVIGRYRKNHLFDVTVKGRFRVRESSSLIPGRRRVTAELDGVRVGMSICFDLRFPELYRELTRRGSRILFVPANFTRTTGKVHWEVLLRARAIENQAFIVAPAQSGRNPVTGIPSFGTSLIVDPWGRVLAKAAATGEALITADLNLKEQNRLRREFAVLHYLDLTPGRRLCGPAEP